MSEHKYIYKDGFVQKYDEGYDKYFTISPHDICEILNDHEARKSAQKISKYHKSRIINFLIDEAERTGGIGFLESAKIIDSLDCE